ncbi:stage III sporulation protein AE [Anaeromicropila herbilytica]|uniref:Stage III sporulation protein AE n=1 Tax=Anaeromicropila herbilytica TaxID=2785025 RepID=A0A7R7EKJ8_9FIRM|nr:stage III sporulation protein AE [Anaeromicropila herbilytica]BCN30395.1 stage III sporulation protein AE [Anaeromicropila herbilytica]
MIEEKKLNKNGSIDKIVRAKKKILVKILWLLISITLLVIGSQHYVYASEMTNIGTDSDTNSNTNQDSLWNDDDISTYQDEFDYSEIQRVINRVVKNSNGIDFTEYVNKLISGKEPLSIKGILSQLKESLLGEIEGNLNIIFELIGLAIVAAIFSNFSNMFKNNQVSETGFYVTYLLLFTILTASFYQTSVIASDTLESVMDFMKALVPTYFLSITFAAGANTSLVFYESTLFLITIVDFILIKVMLPLVNIYMLLILANNLSKEDMLSKFAELIDTLISSALKGLLAFVVGINTIQGFIVPVADSVKNSVLLKATSAIPGVGNSFEAVTKTVLGAGVLVKNAIGVAGLIVIIIICAVPVIKLLLIALIYKFGAAVVQPISDKRIINCINGAARAFKLLFSTVTVGAILFLLTITIIIASTNFRLR